MQVVIKPKLKQVIILANIALLIFIIGLSSSLTLKLFSAGLYPYISAIQRFISALLPFAIGDVLYVLLALYIIRCLNRFYRKYNNNRLVKIDRYLIPLQVLNFMLLLYIVFKLLWGLNYARPTIAKQLGIANQTYNNKQLVALGNYFIVKLNNLKPDTGIANNGFVKQYNIKELATAATFAYKKLEKVNPFFRYNNTSIKPALNSWIISKMGIEGYYNPLSGEANINMRLPSVVLPYTVCHEVAHQIGIAREDEANLVGYLAAINSADVRFKYAAYYSMLRSILYEVGLQTPEDYKLLYQKINPNVLADFKTENEFWREYNNAMFGYLDTAFDQFLKANNQPDGIKSYQNIVLWLYNFHKDEL